jgi:hypothetical protein
MITIARLLLFIPCLWCSLVPYTLVDAMLVDHPPASHDRLVALPWLFLVALLPSVVVAAVVCLPLAWAYGKAAPWIAFALTLPLVGLEIGNLRPHARWLELALVLTTTVSYVAMVVAATMLARRVLAVRRAWRRSRAQAGW